MDTIENDGAGVSGAEDGADVEQRMVSLHLCRYGRDFPGGAINPRKTARGASAQLIASVREDGIIQPPLAKEHEGLFYFAAGDRRLHALFTVHAPHINDKGYPTPWASCQGVLVPIILRSNSNALELGMQENLNRNDLHPVDKMEGFAALLAGRVLEGPNGHEGGGIAPMTIDEIAARFSMRRSQVQTSLRLGALAPEIRDRWREGTLDAQTAEAFILCRDEKQQLKILGRLEQKVGPGGRITPHHVRQALKAQPGEVRRLLSFVTRSVYESVPGCTISESLFSFASLGTEDSPDPEPLISDIAALKEMAENKVADHADVLTRLPKSEGGPWAWAKPIGAMPAGWQSWPRMVLDRKLTIKDREAVGCVVSIDGDGKLHVEEAIYWSEKEAGTGDSGEEKGESFDAPAGAEVVDPRAKPEDDESGGEAEVVPAFEATDAELRAAAEAAEPEAQDDLPRWLQQQLAEQLQAGLSAALSGRNDLALTLVLAAIVSRGDVIAIGRLDAGAVDFAHWSFEEAVERYAAMDQGAQLRALAGIVSEALTLSIKSGEMPPGFMPGPQALMKATAGVMGVNRLKAHLVAAFDIDGYVKAAPKGVLVTAITEACREDQAKKIAGKGIGKIRAFAAENLRAKKWLPAELWNGELLAGKPPKARVVRPKGAKAKAVRAAAATVANTPARKVAKKNPASSKASARKAAGKGRGRR